MLSKYPYNTGESAPSARPDLAYYTQIFIFNHLYLFIPLSVCLKLISFVVFSGELG